MGCTSSQESPPASPQAPPKAAAPTPTPTPTPTPAAAPAPAPPVEETTKAEETPAVVEESKPEPIVEAEAIPEPVAVPEESNEAPVEEVKAAVEEPVPEPAAAPAPEEEETPADEPAAESTEPTPASTAVEESTSEPVSASVPDAAPVAAPVEKGVAPNMKKGWIKKQGQERKNWKKRFFVLEGGKFRYFEAEIPDAPYGSNPKGEIYLRPGMTVTEDDKIVKIEAGTASKEFQSRDMSIEIPIFVERGAWITALRSHIAHDYDHSNEASVNEIYK